MKKIEKLELISLIGRELQSRMTYSDINTYLSGFNIDSFPNEISTNSKWVYVKETLAGIDEKIIFDIADELNIHHEYAEETKAKAMSTSTRSKKSINKASAHHVPNLVNNPWIVGIGVTVIGGLILAGIRGTDLPEAKNATNSNEIVSYEQSSDNLRPLQPLETGKKISQIPNDVYFFGHPSWIETEIKDNENDWLEVSSKDTSYNFEMQKIDNRYYLLGYISDEAQSKIGTISDDSIYTQLFPNKWGGASSLISIPFDAIYTIKAREINLDELKSVSIFDIGFKEVIENPKVHKQKEL